MKGRGKKKATKDSEFFVLDERILAEAEKNAREGKLLDLKSDVTFKSFFSKSSKESAYCRRRMLSAVIGRTVVDTKVLNPEILPSYVAGKVTRLDIHCTLDDGSEVDVEMQNSKYDDEQIKRSVYYVTELAANSLKSGDLYQQMPNIYQIMFMNFRIINDEKLHHKFLLKDSDTNAPLTNIFQIHYIELPKFAELLKRINEVKTLSEIEFWGIMIYMGGVPEVKAQLERFTQHSEDLDMAQALLRTMSRRTAEWYRQKAYEDGERDWNSRMYGAELKGARQKALEAAMNLLMMNILTPEQIAQATSLSLAEVIALKKQLPTAK